MQRKFRQKLIFTAFIATCFVALSVFSVIFLPNRLHSEITIEAGDFTSLSEEQFIKTKDQGEFTEDINDIDLSVPGEYIVRVEIGFMTYRSTLKIIDTQKPIVTLRQLISPLGKEIDPKDFVLTSTDNTELHYEFIEAPDPNTIGIQQVSIQISDLGNNKIIETSTVFITQVKDKVTIEAGTPAPTIDDFLMEERTNETFITKIDSLKLVVGVYPIEIQIGDRILVSRLEVIDTIAPTATVVELKAFVSDTIPASKFVKNIVDASKVTVSYKENIDITAEEGTFEPVILLTDAGNNVTELIGKIVVIKDTEPPVFSGSGLRNRTVYIGESFNVRTQVYAVDNRDGNVSISVSGSVDFSKVGTYPITFTAKDKAGNSSTEKITVTVITHPPFVPKGDTGNSELNALVDKLFSKMLHGDMSTYQVTKAIYDFGRTIHYQAGPWASEWTERAIWTITNRVGNCYGRMYAMEAMYVRAGIANRERIKYNGEHSWNQVDIGKGWQNIDIGYPDVFLVSDSYLFNKAINSSTILDDNWFTETPVYGTVIVQHIDDTSGTLITSNGTISGIVGVKYSTNSVSVSGYSFVSKTSNFSGVFTEATITVVYRYKETD
ncbi:MAG: hypothetical protein CVU85_00140 [Firmicutes bacterium HGW-Firmicutes-10]|jgi:hypothetical protein|nr:MAG: hypothetical protein CVU85_00140 [Firmicutes bacterium HGW-Firmicutes-10]